MASEYGSDYERTRENMVRPIPFKAHKVGLLSAELIEDNFENHYGVEVRKLGKLLSTVDRSTSSLVDSMTLGRDMLKIANSIMLHETYFNCIGDKSEEQREFKPANPLGKTIAHSFNSIENWFDEFSELSKSSSKGTDWIVLVWSERIGQLLNVPVDDKAILLFGLQPILALDVHQSAFEADFGKDKEKYSASFLQCIHWGRVSDRFDTVLQSSGTTIVESTSESITVNELKKLSEQQNVAPLVLDVRHSDDRERYRYRIMETESRDSFNVYSWSSDLPKDKPIVVYCMYGFWVSQDVATELRAQGYDARSLIGGINSWRAMGYEATAI